MSQIGFVLLTHAKPHQTLRLVSRLNSMFGNPPIVIHHDFGKCALAEADFPGNVDFVRPHLSTGWAEFNVVEASVLAMKQLYQRVDAPDWCTVMSGACYPIKSAQQILENFASGGVDAHMQGRPVAFHDPETHLGYERYCMIRYEFASVDKRLKSKRRAVSLPASLTKLMLPFSSDFQCHWGSQWFTVSRRAANYLVEFRNTSRGMTLAKHYQGLLFSEESYFQTALCNAPEFSVGSNNWLYLDWSENKPNPKQLTLADLPALKASSTHFARKIDIDTDSNLLDALDKIIDSAADSSNKIALDKALSPLV